MLISELIDELNELKDEFGDLTVQMADYNGDRFDSVAIVYYNASHFNNDPTIIIESVH